jgi:hypothetical protein
LVVQVSQDDKTGEILQPEELAAEPGPGEPVGRVNLPSEPEPDEWVEDAEVPEETDVADAGAVAIVNDSMMQKILFGLIAVIVMALALFVMLQGVFEQKMPV